MRHSISSIISSICIILALTVFSQAAQAQTFSVIHNFTGEHDGANPYAGLTIGGEGIFYGTTYHGGMGDNGVVFNMTHNAAGWLLTPIYEFTGYSNDGSHPLAGVVIGPYGALYGTTYGGGSEGLGTVFELRPSARVCKAALCYWNETVLHSFTGPDGSGPYYGGLTFDQDGNIYGTTYGGGSSSLGVVFELTQSGGEWMVSILHSFGSGNDGFGPVGGVVFDTAGNLYGTTTEQTGSGGTVFELTPSNGAWTENILFDDFFVGASGYYPEGTLMIDQFGNLYGTAAYGGDYGGGTAFELTPSNGDWNFSVLFSFNGRWGPIAGLTMDAAGNLYGVTNGDGAYGNGMVFKLTNSNGAWTLNDLHDFTGGSDGANSTGAVVLDASGNLYGTTIQGGAYNQGIVWEITP
jgi:uncharacterized repeat protein (TIGR03803 family)